MKTFKEYTEEINEAKMPTVGTVKKLLKGLNFENINPEFFDVQKKNTDAGMGGYDYIQISFDEDAAKSPKRSGDVNLAISALTSKFKGADTGKVSKGFIIIR